MIKLIIIDKTFRHLGLPTRQEYDCTDLHEAILKRDRILQSARDYGAKIKIIIKHD